MYCAAPLAAIAREPTGSGGTMSETCISRGSVAWLPIAVLVTVTLIASGCSKSTDASGGATSSSVAGGDNIAAGPTIPEVVKSTSGTPRQGGKLVFGLEAETDGFDPTVNRWAPSGYEVAASVLDPLIRLDANLDPK